MSEGDAELVEGEQNLSQMFIGSTPQKNQPESQAKEEPCNVCFQKAPDGVFMKCGHGGLCYECALEVWKKTPECYMCRKVFFIIGIVVNRISFLADRKNFTN